MIGLHIRTQAMIAAQEAAIQAHLEKQLKESTKVKPAHFEGLIKKAINSETGSENSYIVSI